MSTAATTAASLTAPTLAVSAIHVWADNPRPRTEFTEEALADILPSIRENGVLEPIVVRSRPKGGFWIVMGERRFQSATLAGLAEVPAILRECDDTTALKLALEENIKRKNLHQTDEAAAYARMGEMDAAYQDPKALAAFVGQTVAHVRRRLKLNRLSNLATEAFRAGALHAAQAERLATLPQMDQIKAMEERGVCFKWLAGDVKKLVTARDWVALTPAVEPVEQLDRWIREHATLDTSDAEVQQDLIEELSATQTDEGAPAITPEVIVTCLKVSEAHNASPATLKSLGVVPRDKWVEVSGGRLCTFAHPALVAHGGPRRLTYGCVDKKCRVHLGKPKPTPVKSPGHAKSTSEAKSETKKPLSPAQQKKHDEEVAAAAARELDARVDAAVRPRAILAIAAHIQKVKPHPTVMLTLAIEATESAELPPVKRVESIAKVKIGNHNIGLYLGLAAIIPTHGDVDGERLRDVASRLKFSIKKIEDDVRAELTKASGKKAK